MQLSKLKKGTIFLLSLLLLPWLSAGAQTPPILESLTVELWPEYDRPEVLIIYRIELSEGDSLPATLTFRLPNYVDATHAVAYQQDGNLFAVDPEQVTLRAEGDVSLLTFPVFSRQLQIEYYDPALSSQEGEERRLTFDFEAPYETRNLTFTIQAPLQAENFNMTPPETSSFTDGDGFTYHKLEAEGISAGETFHLEAGYSRPTNELSTAFLRPSEHAGDVFAAADTGEAASNLSVAYWLIGLGLLLLVISGGSYLWSHRIQRSASRRRSPGRHSRERQAKQKPAKQAPPKATLAPSEPGSSFCYRCGTPLRPEANFCHVCGTERRRE